MARQIAHYAFFPRGVTDQEMEEASQFLAELQRDEPDLFKSTFNEPDYVDERFAIKVVVDGWHIRRLFRKEKNQQASEIELIDEWLVNLRTWIIKELPTKLPKELSFVDSELYINVVAWDSLYRKAEKNHRTAANHKYLSSAYVDRFEKALYDDFKTMMSEDDLFVRWNFTLNGLGLFVDQKQTTELAKSIGSLMKANPEGRAYDKILDQAVVVKAVPYQSGVDARIATEILRAAVESYDIIIVVTSDADYVPAIDLVKKFFKSHVHIVTYKKEENKALRSAVEDARHFSVLVYETVLS